MDIPGRSVSTGSTTILNNFLQIFGMLHSELSDILQTAPIFSLNFL